MPYLGEVSLPSPTSQHLSLHHQITHIQILFQYIHERYLPYLPTGTGRGVPVPYLVRVPTWYRRYRPNVFREISENLFRRKFREIGAKFREMLSCFGW